MMSFKYQALRTFILKLETTYFMRKWTFKRELGKISNKINWSSKEAIQKELIFQNMV